MLTPVRDIRLDPEGKYHFSAEAGGARFVACTSTGRCSVLTADLEPVCSGDLGADVEWVQLDPLGERLLVGRAAGVDVYTVDDVLRHSATLPIAATSFGCCAFVHEPNVVCVANWDGEPELAAWDLESAKVITHASLPDRGGEGYSLIAHPEGEALAAVAISGQSEEWMFWAHYDRGRLRVFDRPEIEDVSRPVFHPAGGHFVSHHERLGLCHMRFPTGQLIGSVTPEQAWPESPDDVFSYDFHFVGDRGLLGWQADLALYEFDLATLRPVRCLLTGIGDRRFGEGRFYSGQSWVLAGRRLLTTDRLFNPGPFRPLEYSLRSWDLSGLYRGESCPRPDADRPFTRALLDTGSSARID